jgi:glycerol-3-phosphate acyltransferase PlsY
METAFTIGLLLIAYLLGSIPAAVWISKTFYGVDIRTLGSGNAGSTNMMEMLGKKAGFSTQAIDLAKGALASALPFFFIWIFPDRQHHLSSQTLEMQSIICGLVSVFGHIYPIFAGFRGGKGINTLVGMMLITNPLACITCFTVFALVVILTRLVAIGSMSGVLTFPLFVLVRDLLTGVPVNWILVAIGFGMFLLVVYTHRSNIRRILKGEEGKSRLLWEKRNPA